MIVYQRYCCVCMSIFVFHTYTISQYVYVFNIYIHIICAIHPTPKGVGFSHISCKLLNVSVVINFKLIKFLLLFYMVLFLYLYILYLLMFFGKEKDRLNYQPVFLSYLNLLAFITLFQLYFQLLTNWILVLLLTLHLYMPFPLINK